MRRAPSLLALLLIVVLSGCAAGRMIAPGALTEKTPPPAGAFVMRDGVRLPYREWLPPSGEPWAVVLALHGMNDSRDAWEIPAPEMAMAGIAVFAPDQRGFGATPTRGLWPSEQALVSDADAMARKLRARYPHAKLILMGESMGAAVLMCLATDRHPPPAHASRRRPPAADGGRSRGT